jgi:hypothetical protein
MALVLKKLAKPPVEQAPIEIATGTSNEVAALIDKIGGMLPEVEKVAKLIKAEAKKLEPYKHAMQELTALVTAVEGRSHDEEFAQVGAIFEAKVGKRTKVRSVIDVQKAIVLLNKAKKGVAYEVVTVPLGKIDAYLTPDEAQQVLKTDWGDRSVTITKKVGLAKAA